MNKFKMYGLTLSMAALLGLTGAGLTAQAEATAAPDITIGAEKLSTDTESKDLTYADIAEMCMPSMVSITNKSVEYIQDYFGGFGGGYSDFFSDFFGDYYGGFGGNGGDGGGREQESISAGSGVIVGEEDDYFLIATNAHVVSGAKELSATFIDETTAQAETVGIDSANDLAIIKVMKSDLEKDTIDQIKVIKFGSSDALRVGEEVVAIGNALGYGQSVCNGIVSAKDRTIHTWNDETYSYDDMEGMIQTDASINPGNSGGALLNMKGELIGINSAKYEDESVEGMGYAIPIDYALPILQNLANGKGSDGSSSSNGSVTLGITCVTVTESEAKQYNAPQGVYVYSVTEGSAADNAGLQKGDIITGFNDKEITTVEELKSALADCKEGDSVKLTVERQAQDAFSSGATSYQKGTLTVTFGTDSTSESTDSSSDESEQPA